MTDATPTPLDSSPFPCPICGETVDIPIVETTGAQIRPTDVVVTYSASGFAPHDCKAVKRQP
jgi:hypothetical protein